MEHKKATLLRTFEQIRELFEDAKKLETVVETISTDSDFEKLSLTGNVIINSLVTKLNDVDDTLKSKYSGRLKRKREKLLTRNQRRLQKEKERILENVGDGSSDDCEPTRKGKKTEEIAANLRENNEHSSSYDSVENGNENSRQTSERRSIETHRNSDEDSSAKVSEDEAVSSQNKKSRKKNSEAIRRSNRTVSKMTDSDSGQDDDKIKPKIKRTNKGIEFVYEDSDFSQDENKNVANKKSSKRKNKPRGRKSDEEKSDSDNLHDESVSEEEKDSRKSEKESADEKISEKGITCRRSQRKKNADVVKENETTNVLKPNENKERIHEKSSEKNDDENTAEVEKEVTNENSQEKDNIESKLDKPKDISEDMETGELHLTEVSLDMEAGNDKSASEEKTDSRISADKTISKEDKTVRRSQRNKDNNERIVDTSTKDVVKEIETTNVLKANENKKKINEESSEEYDNEKNVDDANIAEVEKGINNENSEEKDNLQSELDKTRDIFEVIEAGELHLTEVSLDMEAGNDESASEEETDSRNYADKKISKEEKTVRRSQRNKDNNERTVAASTKESEDLDNEKETANVLKISENKNSTKQRINEESSEEHDYEKKNAKVEKGVTNENSQERGDLESELDKTKDIFEAIEAGELYLTEISLDIEVGNDKSVSEEEKGGRKSANKKISKQEKTFRRSQRNKDNNDASPEDVVKEKETTNVLKISENKKTIIEESSEENDNEKDVDDANTAEVEKGVTNEISQKKDNFESELDETRDISKDLQADEPHLTEVSLDMEATIMFTDSDDENNKSGEVSDNLSEDVYPETAEDKRKCKEVDVPNNSDNGEPFPISVEKLENIVSTFLNSRSSLYENNKKSKEKKKDEGRKEKQVLEEIVMLLENDVSIIELDDDDNLEKDTEDLVGKIKLVDIGKLTNESRKTEMPKIKVADFARLQFSPIVNAETGSSKQLSKREKKRNSKRDFDESKDDSNGTLIRNPFAKRLSKELDNVRAKKDKMLGKDVEKSKNADETNRNNLSKNQERKSSTEIKEQDENHEGRIRNPFARSLKKELEKLKERRHKRLEKKQFLLNHELESTKITPNKKERSKKNKEKNSPEDPKKPSRKGKCSKKSKFVISNNIPITLVPKSILGETSGSTDKVFYCVANPEQLSDTKLLLRCYVNMSDVKRTPDELLQDYKDRKEAPEDLEQLEVRLDDSDDGDDGESDSRTMVLTTSKRTLRSNATSNASSRNSSVNSKRSTRNSKPLLNDKVVKSSSGDDEEAEELSSDDEVLVKKRNGNKATEKLGRHRGSRSSKDDKNGKGKRKERDQSSNDGEDEDDARSHVSISSTSEPEMKKSSNKKNRLKISKSSRLARSSRKNSADSEEESDSDDSVPLTKLPDMKIKKEELDNSDTREHAKKKDKKSKKNKESESGSEESDGSLGDKKKKMHKRAAKKKRVVSDSGSDYDNEDSDDDEIESVKSSASEEKAVVNKPTRKRIKRVNDDTSDDSDGAKPKRGKKKKGEPIDTRKHIRNILSKGALNQSTIDAEQEESDRKKRILDKQKRYNDIYNPKDLESDKMDQVVLDIDDDTNEEILSVDRSIVKHLKPHQAKGIQFMWNACFESISMIDHRSQKGSGCVLAHCMGLGKTLQVIALIHTLITNSDTTKTEKALVVCPLSTVLNWVSEFHKWLKSDIEFEIYELVSCKQVTERQHKIADWHKHGGVMIMGYDMFRNLSNPDNKRITRKARNTFVTGLVDPGPDLVICDEGHLLKNEKTSISIAMNRIRTLRRIVLTGTPLQNNLKEYFCMVQFVKPNLLGTYKEYLNRFVNPITNGQYTDSTPHDIQIMRKRSHVLHKLLDGIVQRRDYAVLAPYLPPKHEYVIFVTLTDKQIALYDHYLKVIAPQQRTQATKGVSLFKDFQEFQRICTHPRVLLDKSVHDQMAKWKEEEDAETDGTEGSIKDFIDDDEDEEESTASETSKSSSNSRKSDDETRRSRNKPPKPPRTTRAAAAEKGIDVAATTSTLEVANTGSEWWREFISDQNLDDLLCSSKLALLFEILHQCDLIGDKVLIFSQSLYSLSIIEYFLSKIDDACQTGDSSAVGGYSSSWSLGLDYFRLDGSSSCDNRAAWCKTFNNPKNTRARLFLISTRAGGLGINLVAANRVIIFDVSWNPSHDIQSIYRVYRFGQVKPSYIYRFVTNGTMEMKVYERQVTKQAISKRVIDEQQIDRHYNQNDLAELYKFEPKPEHRPIPPVPKDVLLGELVHDKAELIYKYHEHHTLLENKEEEELNEDERKAAWDEFENEKKMRQMPAHINNIPIHSIMLGLTNYLKREHPEWSAAEVQTAVPSLVQEMQEKMLLGDVTLYNNMIIELRSLQQQQQQLQQQRMQDYYRLQQQNQERMMLERHRQLMQTNATVSYLQRLYANATGNNMNPAALSAALNNPLGNPQLNANQPQIIETVDIND